MKRILTSLLILLLVALVLAALSITGALAATQRHITTLPIVSSGYDATLPTPAPTIGDPWSWPMEGR